MNLKKPHQSLLDFLIMSLIIILIVIALDAQKENATNDRRIGLGILGLGDMLLKMGIKYDNEDALRTTDQIMRIFRDTAYETSNTLAQEKGAFPKYDWWIQQSKFVKALPKRYVIIYAKTV